MTKLNKALNSLNTNRKDGFTTIDIEFIDNNNELLVKLTNEDNDSGEWSDFIHPLDHHSWTIEQSQNLSALNRSN